MEDSAANEAGECAVAGTARLGGVAAPSTSWVGGVVPVGCASPAVAEEGGSSVETPLRACASPCPAPPTSPSSTRAAEVALLPWVARRELPRQENREEAATSRLRLAVRSTNKSEETTLLSA